MDAIDQQLEAVTALRGQLDVRRKGERERNRYLLMGIELRRVIHAKLDLEVRKALSIGSLQPYEQLMGTIRLCRVDQYPQRKRQTHRCGKRASVRPSDAAAQQMKQPFPNRRSIAEEGTIDLHGDPC